MATLFTSKISQSGFDYVNLDRVQYTLTGKDANGRWITFFFGVNDTLRWDYAPEVEKAFFDDMEVIKKLAKKF